MLTADKIRILADGIDAVLTEHNDGEPLGFVLMTFQFNHEGIGMYVSNAEQDNIPATLREFADHLEKDKDKPRKQSMPGPDPDPNWRD